MNYPKSIENKTPSTPNTTQNLVPMFVPMPSSRYGFYGEFYSNYQLRPEYKYLFTRPIQDFTQQAKTFIHSENNFENLFMSLHTFLIRYSSYKKGDPDLRSDPSINPIPHINKVPSPRENAYFFKNTNLKLFDVLDNVKLNNNHPISNRRLLLISLLSIYIDVFQNYGGDNYPTKEYLGRVTLAKELKEQLIKESKTNKLYLLLITLFLILLLILKLNTL